MPIPILMPALSPTMTEGNLVKWSKTVGEYIRPGDIIAEVETDKATMEIESIEEGTLEKIMFKEGTEGISVNSLIAILSVPKDSKEDIQTLIDSHKKNTKDTFNENIEENKIDIENINERKNEGSDLTEKETIKKPSIEIVQTKLSDKKIDKQIEIQNSIVNSTEDHKILASPLARRMAYINNINLSDIKGTGPKGKIVKSDIEKLIGDYSSFDNNRFNHVAGRKKDKILKISAMRKAIAKRLTESKASVPHFYLSIDCDASTLINVLNEINIEQEVKISVNDIIIKAFASALVKTPEANRSWQENHILIHGNVDVSIAIAVEDGVFAPVIKNANEIGINEISLIMKDFVLRAKNKDLLPDEYDGGNFTISNLGMYGIDSFSAIITPPQAGILSIGRIRTVPIVKNNEVIKTNLMSCQLSGDHRVLDGAIGAKLLNAFKKFIENPSKMLL